MAIIVVLVLSGYVSCLLLVLPSTQKAKSAMAKEAGILLQSKIQLLAECISAVWRNIRRAPLEWRATMKG